MVFILNLLSHLLHTIAYWVIDRKNAAMTDKRKFVSEVNEMTQK